MLNAKHGKDTNAKRELGLHSIEKTFDKEIEETVTKVYDGSLRSGNKVEFEGSVIVTGDVNAGAEVIAEESVFVMGEIRGMVHAGAKGNKKAVVIANSIDAPQIRIADIVKEIEKEEDIDKYDDIIKTRAYVNDNEIILE